MASSASSGVGQKRKRKPGKRCVVMFCNKTNEDGVSLHKFPRDENVCEKWNKFVLTKRDGKAWTPGTGHVCSDHFLQSDYEGYGAKLAGFSSKLVLKKGAVPSIQPNPTPEQLQKARKISFGTPSPSTSQYTEGTPRASRRGNALTKLRAHRTMSRMEDSPKGTSISAESVCSPDSNLPSADDIDLISSVESENISLSTLTASKATQKSFKRPERRSRATQMSIKQNEIGVQCNLADLPPLGQMSCRTESYETDDNVSDVIIDDIYSPSTSDSEEELEDKYSDTESKEMNLKKSKFKGHMQYHDERKYIVFESALLELFQWCPICNNASQGTISDKQGTFIKIIQHCRDPNCQHQRMWTNQRFIRTMPVGNLLLSAAIVMSGLPTEKTLRMFKFCNIACVSRSAFYRHTTTYITPTIVQSWKNEQETLCQQLKDRRKPLILTGDGRCDSPGHSAKFGSYTVIEQTINRVLDFQLVQSNEVKNSSWMEVEGLKRSVQFLTTTDLSIDTLITDRSSSVSKYIRTNLPDTKHYYDIWHVAKGLGKKIDKIAKQKLCTDIGEWKQSICNHMYWCAASTPDGNGNVIKAKWEMLPLHIQNIHRGGNALYPKCGHGILRGENRDRLWLEKGSTAAIKLEELLLKKRVLSDVSKLSPVYQTSTLEAKHSLDIQFVPKHTAFSYWGMQTRLCLSALHYNEAADRMQAVNKEGKLCYSLKFPKAKKGKCAVRPQKTRATYEYCTKAINLLFEQYERSPKELRLYMENLKVNTPPSLTASMEDRPDKEEAIQDYVSRYYCRQIVH